MCKGMDKFLSKLPAFHGPRISLFAGYLIVIAAAAGCFLLLFDFLPGLIAADPADPLPGLLPLAGVLIIIAIGWMMVWQVWRQKARLKQKYGPTSYQRIFLVGFGGIVLAFAAAAVHQFIPVYALSPSYWAESPLAFLVVPLDRLLGVPVTWAAVVKISLSALAGLLGTLLALRALFTFGFDYMSVLYLYFPEESTVQHHEIYSALRHPTYAAVLLLSLSGTLFSLSLYFIIIFVITVLGFLCHIRLVEEKELIQRFGDLYRSHQKTVPALVPRRWGVFFRFLFGRAGK